MPELVTICGKFLINSLDLNNCFDIYSLASTHFCPNAKDASIDYILSNFELINEQTSAIDNISCEDLIFFLSKDRLNVRQECLVFEIIIKWIEFDKENRLPYLRQLLSIPRYAFCGHDYFNTNVIQNDYVKSLSPLSSNKLLKILLL